MSAQFTTLMSSGLTRVEVCVRTPSQGGVVFLRADTLPLFHPLVCQRALGLLPRLGSE